MPKYKLGRSFHRQAQINSNRQIAQLDNHLTLLKGNCNNFSEICVTIGYDYYTSSAVSSEFLTSESFTSSSDDDQITHNYNIHSPVLIVYFCIKTCMLNNLVRTKCNSNCDNDKGHVLDNLGDFLQNVDPVAKSLVVENELFNIDVSSFNNSSLENDSFDLQAVTYVCGFLVKKMKNVECINCYNNLIVSKPESHHFFTHFKEYDNVKLRLKYVSRNVALYIAYIHDVVNVFIQLYGSISKIFEKIQTAFKMMILLGFKVTCTKMRLSYVYLNMQFSF
ncbi:hypothetical protein FQA39_LY18206 [Lamprigera yunnana]|nr:hypothetical protein FQA39_LY18206 [Lamprigera yunnana]